MAKSDDGMLAQQRSRESAANLGGFACAQHQANAWCLGLNICAE